MKIKNLLVLAFVILGVGCATQSMILPDVENIDKPALNVETTRELGDTIVDKGRMYTYPAINLHKEVHGGDGVILLKFVVPPGNLIAKSESSESVYFYSDRFHSHDALIGDRMRIGGLAQSKTNAAKLNIFCDGAAAWFPVRDADFETTKVQALDKPSFRQELIYNGRVGNNVKFLYREMRGDYLRPAFNQEVQYDLNETKEIGFKTARIEIIEATNTQLKYRVLKSFPDLP